MTTYILNNIGRTGRDLTRCGFFKDADEDVQKKLAQEKALNLINKLVANSPKEGSFHIGPDNIDDYLKVCVGAKLTKNQKQKIDPQFLRLAKELSKNNNSWPFTRNITQSATFLAVALYSAHDGKAAFNEDGKLKIDGFNQFICLKLKTPILIVEKSFHQRYLEKIGLTQSSSIQENQDALVQPSLEENSDDQTKKIEVTFSKDLSHSLVKGDFLSNIVGGLPNEKWTEIAFLLPIDARAQWGAACRTFNDIVEGDPYLKGVGLEGNHFLEFKLILKNNPNHASLLALKKQVIERKFVKGDALKVAQLLLKPVVQPDVLSNLVVERNVLDLVTAGLLTQIEVDNLGPLSQKFLLDNTSIEALYLNEVSYEEIVAVENACTGLHLSPTISIETLKVTLMGRAVHHQDEKTAITLAKLGMTVPCLPAWPSMGVNTPYSLLEYAVKKASIAKTEQTHLESTRIVRIIFNLFPKDNQRALLNAQNTSNRKTLINIAVSKTNNFILVRYLLQYEIGTSLYLCDTNLNSAYSRILRGNCSNAVKALVLEFIEESKPLFLKKLKTEPWPKREGIWLVIAGLLTSSELDRLNQPYYLPTLLSDATVLALKEKRVNFQQLHSLHIFSQTHLSPFNLHDLANKFDASLLNTLLRSAIETGDEKIIIILLNLGASIHTVIPTTNVGYAKDLTLLEYARMIAPRRVINLFERINMHGFSKIEEWHYYYEVLLETPKSERTGFDFSYAGICTTEELARLDPRQKELVFSNEVITALFEKRVTLDDISVLSKSRYEIFLDGKGEKYKLVFYNYFLSAIKSGDERTIRTLLNLGVSLNDEFTFKLNNRNSSVEITSFIEFALYLFDQGSSSELASMRANMVVMLTDEKSPEAYQLLLKKPLRQREACDLYIAGLLTLEQAVNLSLFEREFLLQDTGITALHKKTVTYVDIKMLSVFEGDLSRYNNFKTYAGAVLVKATKAGNERAVKTLLNLGVLNDGVLPLAPLPGQNKSPTLFQYANTVEPAIRRLLLSHQFSGFQTSPVLLTA